MGCVLSAPLTILFELKLFLGFFLILPRIVIDAAADRAFHFNNVFAVFGGHTLEISNV